MIAKTSKMIARSARVSDVIGSAKRSSQIAWIGCRKVETCHRELRDAVGRQRNVKLSKDPKSELSNQQNVGKRRPGS